MKSSNERRVIIKMTYDEAKKLADELKNVNFTDRPTFRKFYQHLPDYTKE